VVSVVRVKVCGITRLEDAVIAAEAGADMLGFVKEPSSPRFVNDSELVKACFAVAPYLPFCAVYGWYGGGDLSGISHVQSYDLPELHFWIKTLPVHPNSTVESLIFQAGASPVVLLDKASPHHGGTGEPIDWGLAAEFVQAAPHLKVVLAGGLSPDNVAEAVRKVRPYGVDASSKLEVAPGIKSAEKVRGFVDAAKSA